MFKKLLAFLAVLIPSAAYAQGGLYGSVAVDAFGKPLALASIRVCQAGATGVPCSPTANLFTDSTLATAAANPFLADQNGNYSFYAAPGRYVVQITAQGLTRTFVDRVVPPDANNTGPLAGAFLTGANSGNKVTLLNAQGPAGAVTGTGSAVTLYTYTLPGGVMGVGKGIRISWAASHTTGTASVTYAVTYGGQTLLTNANANTGQGATVIMVFNIGATNSQRGFPVSALGHQGNNAALVSTSVDSTVNQVINMTFSAANTEQITPEMFVVELIQ
jgi:hypothetical protein